MATATTPRLLIGPDDAGRRVSFAEFVAAEFVTAHHLYELARGIIDVTEVPGIHHGQIVERISDEIGFYKRNNPGRIHLRAGGGECRLRLPGMESDRHPDQAVYLTPPPRGKRPWTRWVPALVVEVVSRGGEDRDYRQKREEYLRAGVLEYWIFDPHRRKLVVLSRAGDTWEEAELGDGQTHECELLPGLVVSVSEILGPLELEAEAEDDADGDEVAGTI